MNLNIKTFEDGKRLILVFENCRPDTKNMIGQIIASIAGSEDMMYSEQIQNVVPIEIPEDKVPSIPETVPEINERDLLEQKGFAGFVDVYEHFKKYKEGITEQRKEELTAFIRMQASYLKSRNPSEIPDEELRNILSVGLRTIFASKLKLCLQQTTCLSLQSLLSAGRQYQEYAYSLCVN